MNGTVQIPMKYRHWSQKSPNLNGRTRTRSQFLRITQAVCMTTPLCCLLFSFCHFGYCVGTELLLLSNLCISPGCSNKQHPNEQIFFFFFLPTSVWLAMALPDCAVCISYSKIQAHREAPCGPCYSHCREQKSKRLS